MFHNHNFPVNLYINTEQNHLTKHRTTKKIAYDFFEADINSFRQWNTFLVIRAVYESNDHWRKNNQRASFKQNASYKRLRYYIQHMNKRR